MKFFPKSSPKSEKGQVLVFLALTMIGLVAIIGLAIDTGYMYVSYSRLRRGVDAAALAGTGEFKIPAGFTAPCYDPVTDALCLAARDANIYAAAKQMLDLNKIVPDSTATFSDPMPPNTVGMSIQTCQNTPGDPVLCNSPLQKIIRVKVQEQVPVFFLSVIGLRSVPIVIDSLATAGSADVMLTIDTSDSMTYDVADDSPMRDPNACNPNSCRPMQDVKTAAQAFADQLYYPYDRLGVVRFDQYATMVLALSDSASDIEAAISSLEVFEGVTSTLADNSTQGTQCIYYLGAPELNNNDPDLQDPVPPHASTPNTIDYNSGQPDGPCRLYYQNQATGVTNYYSFDCPQRYGPDPNPSRCGTTNIAGGINLAGRALTGVYPAAFSPGPANREDSIWVLVLLSDGAATAAYDSNGDSICPAYTWDYDYTDGNNAHCRDKDVSNTIAWMLPGRHSSLDPWYDVDDQARDMFDIVNGDNISIYTIGLGTVVTKIPVGNNGPPGETLLKYPETVLGNGQYFAAPSASDLGPVFLAIANLITSRINE